MKEINRFFSIPSIAQRLPEQDLRRRSIHDVKKPLLKEFKLPNNGGDLFLIDHCLEPPEDVHVLVFQVRQSESVLEGKEQIASQHYVS